LEQWERGMEKVIAKILADVGIGGIKDLKKMGSIGCPRRTRRS